VARGYAANSIPTVCSNRTRKPGPLAPDPTWRPFDGNPFLYIAPAPTEIYTLSLHDALPILGLYVDRGYRLAVPSPGPGKQPGRPERTGPRLYYSLEGSANPDSFLAVTRIARHLSLRRSRHRRVPRFNIRCAGTGGPAAPQSS